MDARTSENDFELLVASPQGLWDASLPIAAARAGAVGLLDLTYLCDASRAVVEAGRLARLARGKYGVVLHGRPDEIGRQVLALLPSADVLLLTCEDEPELTDALAAYRGSARRVGLIVTSEDEARLAGRLGFDFVAARGNEAGGRVRDETTFVLVQRLRMAGDLPLYAWGGVGLHTAAACRVAGCAGLVLDWQLALMPECTLPGAFRRRLEQMDGSETIALSAPGGRAFRALAAAGMPARERLQALSDRLNGPDAPGGTAWDRAIGALMAEPNADARLWAVGQEAAFARRWAAESPTVSRALGRLREQVVRAVQGTDDAALGAGSPLAQSHGTHFPVVQGPMTRVSDVPEFAEAVFDGGGLPVLALAMMRQAQVADLLRRTRERMGKRSWGVGILGFAERELRAEQMQAVEEVGPPFAVIAGGRPDQAASLEARGIATYLHVPSPHMLDTFVKEGARRFVFEGRECGGHVGPRSSFVLWEAMIDVLLHAGLSDEEAAKVHVLFAGGIHDGLSGAMVAALSQPLAARGMKVGVLIGTAYLFTDEAVRTGAVRPGYQEVALETRHTVLVETGPGHAIRCADTDFVRYFETEKRRLKAEGRPAEEVREELEGLNLGRLRIAAKGVTRRSNPEPGASPYAAIDDAGQRREGMYMIGQVAALCRGRRTIRELHEEVCTGAGARLRACRERQPVLPTLPAEPVPPPLDVAIVGLSCLLPGAETVEEFWHNLLAGLDQIEEVPPHRFDAARWFDPDPKKGDKIYSKWGGFLGEVPFDPLKYGIPPTALKSIEPGQLLALELVDRALRDAGCAEYNPYRERTSVIFGVSGGVADLGQKYIVRALLPQLFDHPDESLWEQLPPWTEDSFAGILPNIVSGRVSNRFDFGGANFTVDAACASSLAAVHLACRSLADGTSDVVIAGGCDLVQGPFAYHCFASSGALSPRGRSRAFDAGADGIAISEGLAAVVLKRRADAERDGDRIYAVIRAVAGGSDGRSKGLTAPRPEGQARTLRRAYAQAGFSPATVGLFEAHGTGTALGDATECRALTEVLEAAGAAPQSCAVGSVKSVVGHTKSAAGIVGVLKAALALHHRVLPPTLHVERPNPKAGLAGGPLYVNSQLRPWVRGEQPRRAGVSSFGFGGTNFHAVLEEYEDSPVAGRTEMPRRRRPAELFVFGARTSADLTGRVRSFAADVRAAVEAGAAVDMADLAFAQHRRSSGVGSGARAAVVAATPAELLERLAALESRLGGNTKTLPAGVCTADRPLAPGAPLAFLFPGQGAQFPDMLRDLAVEFAEVADAFAAADSSLRETMNLTRLIFPPPAFTDEERSRAAEALKATDVAQPALGACGVALHRLMASFGVRPAMTAGHSYGELAALWAAESLDETTLFRLSRARGKAILSAAGASGAADLGGMLAAQADAERVRDCLNGCTDVWLANHNSPRQVAVSGTRAGIARAAEALGAAGIASTPLTVACGFHSPLMAPARERFRQALAEATFRTPKVPVYSNVTATPYPAEADGARGLLAEQLVNGVEFARQVEAMYAAGARVFVELGPKRVLTKFVDDVLGDRPHLAAAIQGGTGDGMTQLLHALAALFVQGVPMDLERLYEGRRVRPLDLRVAAKTAREPHPAHLWLVNGSEARPAGQPRSRPAPRKAAPATTRNGSPSNPPPPAAPAPAKPKESVPMHNGFHATNGRAERLASVPAPAPAPAHFDAFAQHQETMRLFLTTQMRIFEAFIGSGPGTLSLPEPAAASHLALTESLALLPEVAPAPPPPVAEVRAAAPPPPLPEPPPAPPQARPAAPAAPDLGALLLDTACERTGYPADMLGLDANLEADLGIDSIKRVEIIAAFRRAALPGMADPPSWFMEEMTAAKTLRAIRDGVARLLGGASAPAREKATVAGRQESPRPFDLCPRCVGAIVDAPLDADTGVALAAGVTLLTDGDHAAAFSSAIEGHGGRAFVIATEDLATPERAAAAVARLRQEHRRIAGLLHLLPLREAPHFPGIDAAAVRRYADEELKGLLFLLQALAPELSSGRAFVVAASRGGGDFGAGEQEAVHPWRGGLAGMLKTAAKEWPDARFRAVDVDNPLDPSQLLRETAAAGAVEVGYRDGRRLAVRAVRQELPEEAPTAPAAPLGPGSVVLVTGGARGITAEVAREVAEQTRATVILLGRSPVPSPAEAAATAALTDAAALRRALVVQLRQAGESPSPREVETRLQRLLGERAIRQTMAALAAAGSRAEYIPCDVRDAEALAAVIRDVRQRHGEIDGLVHGAGVIEDRRILDKTPESFDRVFHTKVAPLAVLAKLLDPARLKLVMVFSSVAGFLGNEGQVDYAAANEVLNRMTRRLATLCPGKVVALNWGPWDGTGMVTPEVARQFATRGVGLVSVNAGRRAVRQELLHRGGDVRVLIGPGHWVPAPPLLAGQLVEHGPGGGVEARVTLDAERQDFLRDHCIDGKPVLPLAVALELMAETAACARPDWQVTQVGDLRLFSGVVLEGGPRVVVVRAEPGECGREGGTWQVRITSPESPRRPLYAATVRLSAQPASPPAPPQTPVADASPLNAAEAYQQWLFHGPAFQVIERLNGLGSQGVDATVRADRADGWVIDPIVLDAAPQLSIIWSRARYDTTPLPNRIRSYQRHGVLGDGPIEMLWRAEPGTDGQTSRATVWLVRRGRVVGRIDGLEGTASSRLNRLAGKVLV